MSKKVDLTTATRTTAETPHPKMTLKAEPPEILPKKKKKKLKTPLKCWKMSIDIILWCSKTRHWIGLIVWWIDRSLRKICSSGAPNPSSSKSPSSGSSEMRSFSTHPFKNSTKLSTFTSMTWPLRSTSKSTIKRTMIQIRDMQIRRKRGARLKTFMLWFHAISLLLIRQKSSIFLWMRFPSLKWTPKMEGKLSFCISFWATNWRI